jgi:hypothetical protein
MASTAVRDQHHAVFATDADNAPLRQSIPVSRRASTQGAADVHAENRHGRESLRAALVLYNVPE